MMAREVAEKKKLRTFSWVLVVMCMSKEAREFAHKFLMALDIEKVKLSEAAWYFNLRRDSYNYGGKSLEVRLIEAEKVDREKNHIILEI